MVFNNNTNSNKKFNSTNTEDLKIVKQTILNNSNTKMNKNGKFEGNTISVTTSSSSKLGIGVGGGGISSSSNSSGDGNITSTSASSDAGGKKKLSNEDKKINLNALKNQDPFATNIIDTAFRVAVYKFVSKKNEWKKLDVEGSLFLFERMVEPLHSFVVMNTLALHLFLQPITYDLEFQDRNPFLLYKSNTDIYGIWFIDKEDCERIKTLIISLTESAKERRHKREKSNNLVQNNQETITTTTTTTASLDSFKCPNLITPTSLLSTINPATLNNSINSDNNTKTESNDKPIDIMKMLSKAQMNYNQSKNKTTNDNGGNSLLHIINSNNTTESQWSHDLLLRSSSKLENDSKQHQDEQHVQQQPISLNTSSSIASSPPASSASSTSTGYSSGSVRGADETKKINPILQLLLPATSNMNNSTNSNNTNETTDENKLASLCLKSVINSINAKAAAAAASSSTPIPTSNQAQLTAQDLISLELKRKLNIQPSSNSATASVVLPEADDKSSLSSSLMQTPSNQLILNNFAPTLDSINTKRPITLRDFEENLLNESSTSTPSNQLFQPPLPQQLQHPQSSASTVFYLGDSSSNLILRPNHLTFTNKDKELNKYTSSSSHHSSSSAASTLSSRSSRSSSTSSSTSSKASSSSTSSEPPLSPTTLPLLLTPAAFESSSVSSSTSTTSSSKANHFFSAGNANPTGPSTTANQHVSLIEQAKKNSASSNHLAASSFGNILFSNQLINFNDLAAEASAKAKKTKKLKSNASLNTLTVLTKSQLKNVLIHLLTSDDKFITSLHQAYLEANLAFAQQQQLNGKTKAKQDVKQQNDQAVKTETTSS